MKKILSTLLPLYIFLLPWQARYIFAEYSNVTPYFGGLGLYVTDLLFVLLLLVWTYWMWTERKRFPKLAETRDWRLGLLMLFLLFSLLSVFWSPLSNLAFYSWLRILQALFLGAIIFTTPIKIRKLYLAILAAGVIQAFVGIGQFFLQEIPANTYLGMAEQQPHELGVSVVQYLDQRWLRAHGTFPHPNILGAFLSVSALIASAWFYDVYLQMRALVKRWDEVTVKEVKPIRLQIIASLSSFVFLLIGLLFTFSRTAWLGFGIGWLLLTILLIRFYHKKQEARLIAVAGIKQLVAGGLIFASLTLFFGPLWTQRLHDDSRLGQKSQEERTELTMEAEEVIKLHPLLGSGIGSYLTVVREQNPGQHAYSYQPVHNTWILLWAELGIIGTIPFIGFLFYILFVVKLLTGKRKANLNEVLAYALVGSVGMMMYFEHFWWTLSFGILLIGTMIAIAVKERVHLKDN
jgi:hypothetical protein